jgi:uncharacterized protein (DUF2147 family)
MILNDFSMKMMKLFFARVSGIVMIVLLFGFVPISAQQADAILGDWVTENGEAHVKVYQLKGEYHAKITWVKNDQESSKINTLILSGFVYDAIEKEWNSGKVYDPRHGHKASGYLVLKDSKTLKVVGYKAFRWISDSETWKKIETR